MKLNIDELKEIIEDLAWDHNAVGIRFEEKDYKVGEVINNSKHNQDREDEREFPQFESPEYDELSELPGVSTWNRDTLDMLEAWIGGHTHCYVVVGDGSSWYDSVDECVLDDNELLIEDGRVAMILK